MSAHSRQVDLTNCDREPIHIPGSIQPHGCLIAADASLHRILRHSANVSAMLGFERPLIGETIDAVVGPRLAHRLRNALATVTEAGRAALLVGAETDAGQRFDIAVHQFKATTIIEFEPARGEVEPALELARSMIARTKDLVDVDRLTTAVSRVIRGVLGYDRVMVYRFSPDGAGQVISEARRGDLESFLGQWFPASDIPQQARALYLRNTIRIISNADNERVPILPLLDASGEALDLSFAHLRSVSPIHCEYLRNMGVAASMSISIIVNGALWGLIACHHYEPRHLSMAQRVAAEMFGEFFSLHLHTLLQKRSLHLAAEARATLDRLLSLSARQSDPADLIRDNLAELAGIVGADGAGVWIRGAWQAFGSTPPTSAIPQLLKTAATAGDGDVWATHCLAERVPAAEDYIDQAAGMLAIPLSRVSADMLLFFRRELVQTINWAGNPDKSYETGPLGDRLTPRKSFAIWQDTVRLQSSPWSDRDRQTAQAIRSALVETLLRHSDLLADERAKSDVRQRMLNEELNHRVKNILAIIKSLVGHPIQAGRTLGDYVAVLKGRIQALSQAHDQVVRGDGGGDLRGLIEAELLPYRSPTRHVVLEGPAVWLDARAFSVMALVLHEMATNAAKYGAFSRDGGQLDIVWTFDPDAGCAIRWRESNGPLVTAPTRTGLGTALIDRAIPHDLGGTSEVTYAPGGVTGTFVIPQRHAVARLDDAPRQAGAAPQRSGGAAGKNPLEGLTLLLVEDQLLVALDVETMLMNAGAARVVVAGSVKEAMARLTDLKPDLAILDVNLGMETSEPIARKLAMTGIPFLFATGYGDGGMIPQVGVDVPVVRKPYEIEAIVEAVGKLGLKP